MSIKTKIRISLLAIIILCLVFIIFLIYPLFNDIKKSSSGILEQKQKLLLLESKVENLEKFKNRYAGLEPDFKKIEELFIKADLPVDFIRFLEKTVKDSDLSAKISLSSSWQAEGKPWQISPFQMAVNGLLPNFLGLLERLQNSRYLIDIQDLSVSSQESGDVSANISFWVLAK
jgi:hypothetical protein